MADIFKSIAFYGPGAHGVPAARLSAAEAGVVTLQALPTTVKTINMHDLHCNAHGEITMTVSCERRNHLLVLGGSSDFLDLETRVQAFTLAGWSYYHKDTPLAMGPPSLMAIAPANADGWGHAGAHPVAKLEGKLAELNLLRSVLDLHTQGNSQWWHEYCDMLQADSAPAFAR
jgi:hypothetical protein